VSPRRGLPSEFPGERPPGARWGCPWALPVGPAPSPSCFRQALTVARRAPVVVVPGPRRRREGLPGVVLPVVTSRRRRPVEAPPSWPQPKPDLPPKRPSLPSPWGPLCTVFPYKRLSPCCHLAVTLVSPWCHPAVTLPSPRRVVPSWPPVVVPPPSRRGAASWGASRRASVELPSCPRRAPVVVVPGGRRGARWEAHKAILDQNGLPEALTGRF
jgi:hypothetical protein